MPYDPLTSPLPPRHPLDFYRVLGTVVGLLMCQGYSRSDAQDEALARLARCNPSFPQE